MLERRNKTLRTPFGGVWLGLAAMGLLGAIELTSLFFEGRLLEGKTSTEALYVGSLVALFLGWGALLGLLAGLTSLAVARLTDTLTEKRVEKPKWAVRIYALLAALPVAYFCANVFEGRKARQIPYKDLASLALGAVLLALAYGIFFLLVTFKTRLLEKRLKPWQRGLGLFVLAVAMGGTYLLDKKVFPGLYGFFHVTLALVTMVSALLFFYGVYLELKKNDLRFWGTLVQPKNVALAIFVTLSLGGLGLVHLGRHNKSRATAFKKTVLGAKLLRGAKKMGLLPKPKRLEATVAKKIPPPRAPGLRLPNRSIVLISVDALRADRVGLYGSKKGLTPNIDKIFDKGTRFTRCYTPMPQTSYAVTSLITGSYLVSSKRVRRVGRRATIPEALHRFEYKTAAFYPPAVFFIDRKYFRTYEKTRLGFEHYTVQYHKTHVDDDAVPRTDTALALLESWGAILKAADPKNEAENDAAVENQAENDAAAHRKASRGDAPPPDAPPPDPVSSPQPGTKKKFFVWIHYFDPHHPYDRRKGHGPQGDTDLQRYESEIAYVDAQIGRLYDRLIKKRPNTIFVLTADHGEAFGEHGTSAHGTSLYEEQIRVPLLVAGRGIPKKTIYSPVELVDVGPTLLSLVDVPLPATMEGTDLTPFLGDAPESAMPPAYSKLSLPDRELEVVARDRYKLISDRSHSTLELYNLAKDPHERNPSDIDNSKSARRKASELLGHLNAWRRSLRGSLTTTTPHKKKEDIGKKLRSPDPEERRRATRTLLSQKAGRKHKKRLIEMMRSDPDVEVRHRAAILLARLGWEGAMVPVENLLERPDLPVRMRRQAAMALAKAKRKSAVPFLLKIYRNTKAAKPRRMILRTLGRLEDIRALGLLVNALNIAGVALQATKALADLGHTNAVKPLLRRLELPKTQAVLRAEIVKTLGVLGSPSALQGIRRRLKTESDALVVAACLDALIKKSLRSFAPPHSRGWPLDRLQKVWPKACATADQSKPGCLPPHGATLALPKAFTSSRGKNIRREIWLLSRGETPTTIPLFVRGKEKEVSFERARFHGGAVVRLILSKPSSGEGQKLSLGFGDWPEGLRLVHVLTRTLKDTREEGRGAP